MYHIMEGKDSMKASELKSCIERMILQYGDLEITFKDEYKNNVYDIKDVMVSFLKKEDYSTSHKSFFYEN